MEKFINVYLEEMAATRSVSTVKNHKSTLNQFLKFRKFEEPAEILPEDVSDFKKMMLANGTVGTANTKLKRIKEYLSWCVTMQLIELNPADEVKLVSEAATAPKWLSREQKGALLRAINRDFLGVNVPEARKSYRELLIVLLMLKSGLRVGEVCRLKWKDVNYSERKGTILVRSNKNDQQRTVGITSDTLSVLKQYDKKHGRKGEYVFYSRQSDTMSERTIQKILDRYKGLKTEVAELEEITPHMLRHTFAHDLATGGMAIEAIARLMGHTKRNGQANIQQTIRYTMRSNTEIYDEMEEILAVK